MTDHEAATFRAWKRRLRREFPSRYPVRVMLVPPDALKDEDGDCYGNCQELSDDDGERMRFVVRISNREPLSVVLHTLIHEYSHVLRDHIHPLPGDSPHDEIFAAVHGRIYRAFIAD